MSGHTPGPWMSEGQLIVAPSSPVADCMTGRPDDAKLLAAAPELVAAAEALLDKIGYVTGIEAERRALIAALDKAGK